MIGIRGSRIRTKSVGGGGSVWEKGPIRANKGTIRVRRGKRPREAAAWDVRAVETWAEAAKGKRCS